MLRIFRGADVVLHRDLEEQEFVSLGVGDSGDVNGGVLQGRIKVSDIEEKKSGLGRVRLDSAGGELGGFNFVHLLLGDATLHPVRERERIVRAGFGLRIREAAVKVVGLDRRELRAVASDQLDSQIGNGDGLISVVGHDEEDRKKSVVGEIDGEDLRLLRIVIGIGSDGYLFIAMKIVGGIVEGGLGDGFDETLASLEDSWGDESEKRDQDDALARLRYQALHALIIR